MNHKARLPLAVFLSFLVACGGAPASVPEAPAAAPEASPGAAPPAPSASPDAGPWSPANPAPAPGDGGGGADAGPDSAACPPTLSAQVDRCASLVGSANISALDTFECINAMSTVRTAPGCMTEDELTAFDETVLRVAESSLALSRATCDMGSLQQRLRIIDRYVAVARSLAAPAEPVGHAKLVRLDDSFWRGVYWGDARAKDFDRATLRAVRADSLSCANEVLDAVLTDQPKILELPLKGAPVVGIVSEALAALAEGYDRTTLGKELACAFVTCSAPETPFSAATWATLGALDDGDAMARAMGGSPPLVPWAPTLLHLVARHALLEAAVVDALGTSAPYSPSLLSSPDAADLPAFAALVDVRDHARALVSTYAATGRYLTGPTTDLHMYAADSNYAATAAADAAAQLKTVSDAFAALRGEQTDFVDGARSSYDARPLATARRAAALWMATNLPPLFHLRAPRALQQLGGGALGALASPADGPTSFGDFIALDAALSNVSTSFVPDAVSQVQKVVISFPNPSYVAQPGEAPIPWSQAEAAHAKSVWDALASGKPGTIALAPEELYNMNGVSALPCTQASGVLRGVGFAFEYPAGAVPAGSSNLSLPFTAPASQPYVTAEGRSALFSSDDPSLSAGTLPFGFGGEPSDWHVGDALVVARAANGASPLAAFTVDFSTLTPVIAASGWAAPRALDLYMLIDAAPMKAQMPWISTCRM